MVNRHPRRPPNQILLTDFDLRTVRRRVVCGCMFHHEFAALDWRLHELEAVVDEFVVVESVRTHSGHPRDLVRPDRDPRFARFRDRLHTFVIADPPGGPDPWPRERHQRQSIWTVGASTLSTSDDDLIIISDVDEVPYPEVVQRLAFSSFQEPIRIRPRWFNFDWNTYLGPWPHDSIRLYPAGLLRQLTEGGRAAEIGDNSIPGRELSGLNGWHASWFGSDEFILEKLSAYSHAFDDKDLQLASEGVAGIHRRRHSGLDMYGERERRDGRPRLPKHAHRIGSVKPP
ncbi:MAG: hypothetical protein AB7G88_09565 [Thermomicrobiales bacterium]